MIHRGSPLPAYPFDAAVFASCCGLSGCHLLSRHERGASTPGSLPTPATCYGASWQLPRRDFHPLVIEPFAGHTWIRAKPEPIDREAAVEYLSDLERLWADAPHSRRVLAEALFERIEVTALELARVFPTDRAVQTGLAEAFQARTAGSGRGETACPSDNHLSAVERIRLAPTYATGDRMAG